MPVSKPEPVLSSWDFLRSQEGVGVSDAPVISAPVHSRTKAEWHQDLWQAIRTEDPVLLRKALDHGARPTVLGKKDYPEEGVLPLDFIVKQGWVEGARLLFPRIAKDDPKYPRGMPGQAALLSGSMAMLEWVTGTFPGETFYGSPGYDIARSPHLLPWVVDHLALFPALKKKANSPAHHPDLFATAILNLTDAQRNPETLSMFRSVIDAHPALVMEGDIQRLWEQGSASNLLPALRMALHLDLVPGAMSMASLGWTAACHGAFEVLDWFLQVPGMKDHMITLAKDPESTPPVLRGWLRSFASGQTTVPFATSLHERGLLPDDEALAVIIGDGVKRRDGATPLSKALVTWCMREWPAVLDARNNGEALVSLSMEQQQEFDRRRLKVVPRAEPAVAQRKIRL